MSVYILQRSSCMVQGGVIEMVFSFSQSVSEAWLDCFVTALNELGALDESECTEKSAESVKVRCRPEKVQAAIASVESAVTVANFACPNDDIDIQTLKDRARLRAKVEKKIRDDDANADQS